MYNGVRGIELKKKVIPTKSWIGSTSLKRGKVDIKFETAFKSKMTQDGVKEA